MPGKEPDLEDMADQTIPMTIVEAQDPKDGMIRTAKDLNNKNRHTIEQCVIVLTGMFVVLIAGVLYSLYYRDIH